MYAFKLPIALAGLVFVLVTAAAGCDRSEQSDTTSPERVVVATTGTSKPQDPGSTRVPGNSNSRRQLQLVQEYFFSFEEDIRTTDGETTDFNPYRFYTHLGTDYGRMGPGEHKITWDSGQLHIDVRETEWAGVWHSLAGLAKEKDRSLDFRKCYPFVRDEYQPKCTGISIRLQGSGRVKLEIKSNDEKILWKHTEHINTDEQSDFVFDCSPELLRNAKLLNLIAEPGTEVSIDSIGLLLEFPKMSFENKVFLVSYSKLARCYSEPNGTVKDRANYPAGEFDSVPASGLFCLATCAAWQLGIVERTFAEQTLRKVHHTMNQLPKAHGILPHFIRKYEGQYRIHKDTEYSTVDTSIYYHSMLIAAQMLSDENTLMSLTKAVKEIDFDRLHNADGYVIHGFKDDGRTPLTSYWRDWGGETALVLLLERMSEGMRTEFKMSNSGKVHNGVGFIAEIQGLFYPHFSFDKPDAITGVNWLEVRRDLLQEQMDYFPKTWPESAARKLGLYGLSAGEGPRGVGYTANGTKIPNVKLLHPHYILLSGSVHPRPTDVYELLKEMESNSLFPPWGMVENVAVDFSHYLPMLGSLNASFECISAYHLWATVTGETDQIYEATESLDLLNDAIKEFYPDL